MQAPSVGIKMVLRLPHGSGWMTVRVHGQVTPYYPKIKMASTQQRLETTTKLFSYVWMVLLLHQIGEPRTPMYGIRLLLLRFPLTAKMSDHLGWKRLDIGWGWEDRRHYSHLDRTFHWDGYLAGWQLELQWGNYYFYCKLYLTCYYRQRKHSALCSRRRCIHLHLHPWN